MTYSRDSNYQMFVVVALSRWWYLMQVGAQPPGGAVPGPDVPAPESRSAPARAGCSGSPSRRGLIGPDLSMI